MLSLPRSTLFPYTTLFRSILALQAEFGPGRIDQLDLLLLGLTARRGRSRRWWRDRKSTRLNSSHMSISYAVFCLKKKNNSNTHGYSIVIATKYITLNATEC